MIRALMIMLSISVAAGGASAQPAIEHALRARYGPTWLPARQRSEIDVLVRLERPELLEQIVAAAGPGVRIRRVEGRPLAWRDWALLRVDARGAAALRHARGVRELRVPPPLGRPPLDRSRALLGVDAARGAGGVSELRTGSGVLIADVDSLVDVYHPDFFRADAGWYDWIDVDGDGRFSPGTDAIDLDHDGAAGPSERAELLAADLFDLTRHSTDALRRPGLDPSLDWLYLDTNQDGERNHGAEDGFTDDDPAFGEPLFVPDDVDRDGVLDPEERVVRLGSSKLRAVYVHVDYPGLPSMDHVYRRGVDLSATPQEVTGGAYGYADALHATGVLGILAAGVALPSRRLVGIAPDAELVDAFEIADTNAGALIWAYGEHPNVMLHEYVTWTFVPLDGADPTSEVIDASTSMGIVNVCPAGNIGGAGKHVARTLAAGEEGALVFHVPTDETAVFVSLHARGEGTLVAELVEPSGAAHTLTMEGGMEPAAGGTLVWYGETTTRGTEMRHAYLDGPTPSDEGWEVHVRAEGGALVVHGMLSDDRSGFGHGAAWDDATDDSTIAWPATADSCIAVGAIPGHPESEGVWYAYNGDEAVGQVRAYSPRGPRIDGDLRPHVVAPDNPWTPLVEGDIYPSVAPGAYIAPHGTYQVFSGTSGAGPHVAGVAALLVQSGIQGADAVDAIVSNTIADPFAGELPNDDYGHGRVSAGAALDGVLDGAAPTISLRAEPAFVQPGEPVRLIVEASDPDGDMPEVRWDDDYDGTWDTGYAAPRARTVSFLSAGRYRWKVRARDASGRVSDAAALLVVSFDSQPMQPDAGVDAGDTVPDAGTEPMPGGGCGCRAAGGHARWPAVLGLLVACAVMRRRWRH